MLEAQVGLELEVARDSGKIRLLRCRGPPWPAGTNDELPDYVCADLKLRGSDALGPIGWDSQQVPLNSDLIRRGKPGGHCARCAPCPVSSPRTLRTRRGEAWRPEPWRA